MSQCSRDTQVTLAHFIPHMMPLVHLAMSTFKLAQLSERMSSMMICKSPYRVRVGGQKRPHCESLGPNWKD